MIGWSVGLTGDEAHYALYAAHPALSYYDHPPLVGWSQWPLVQLGVSDGTLRLLPNALWLATALLIYHIAIRLHLRSAPLSDPSQITSSGSWALLAFCLAPLPHVLGLGLLPDTLLMFFTAALMLQTLRLLEPVHASELRQWLLLGVLLGLAGLAKYTALFAAIPVAVCLLLAHGARLLRHYAPWLAMFLAMVMVLPVFLWNASNHWISFSYQLQHGAGSHWQVSHLATFMLVQLMLYPLLLWGALAAIRQIRIIEQAARWLTTFALLPFGVLAYLSGGGSSLPHWTAPAWVALAPFAGLGLSRLWAGGQRWLIWLLAGLQATFSLGLFLLILSAGPTQLRSDDRQPETFNPFTDFYGWDRAGQHALALAKKTGETRLVVQNWTLASRLAWYARPLTVHVIAPGFDQFSIWSGPLASGANALLLDWSQMAYQQPVGRGQFERCEKLDTLKVERAGRPIAHFSFYLCTNWGGQPQPRRSG